MNVKAIVLSFVPGYVLGMLSVILFISGRSDIDSSTGFFPGSKTLRSIETGREAKTFVASSPQGGAEEAMVETAANTGPAGDAPADEAPALLAKAHVAPNISAEGLLTNAERLLPRYNKVVREIANAKCGIGHNDGLALVSMIDMAAVDVLLESGTSVGSSTELMGRFFEGTPLEIVTVDMGAKGGEPCAANLANTHARLKKFPNILALVGNSFNVFPELIAKHKGRRIGLFIDGPKGGLGVRLCKVALSMSTDVKFCLFHDVGPEGHGKDGVQSYTRLSNWDRTLALTCCWDEWLTRLGEDRYGPCMGVVTGEEIPGTPALGRG